MLRCALQALGCSQISATNYIEKRKSQRALRVCFDARLQKAHPVVPGSPICGMRMLCGGRERAWSGCEAIGVSTVPLGQKPQKTATGMRTSSSRQPKNWKPTPGSDFVSRPYMLMNLGQRDEPCVQRRIVPGAQLEWLIIIT